MTRCLFTLLAIGCLSSTCLAQLTAKSIRRSEWDTKYEAIGGGEVRAILTFNGQGGSYNVGGARGLLSNVTYEVRPQGAATIKGNWTFKGTKGAFTFFVAANSKPPEFSGAWQAKGQSGGWHGRLIRFVPGGSDGANVAAQPVTYSPWTQTSKGNYYRRCDLPAGGCQYLILFSSKPQWVYWYNPTTKVYWCCCPTVRHPEFGNDAANGVDQFLLAIETSNSIEDTRFPKGADPNFTSRATAKDKDGSVVALGCPPSDLPQGL